ncbi:HD-GYP domain-containing protein [Clostridium sp. MT-14]|uniref:HD-GYP domain-containing protein n=1 Tax=Clostridium aromativorans TaxID=2836848 RepID=A0ABS8N0J7_9CLOT|nr:MULTISPECIES: HD-GYP domain-containing protein [Clostridium]KAA8664538.1 HD-GYP domain-containing protein [Clostridium sp. HV4-5-A1G]MCC9293319.1 HD-GYP domain-containing protein [Clostridium aromativorans]
MRLEFINRVKEKDILGKSILTSEGQVLLRAGVELNSSFISKLKELGVFYLYVEDERLEDVQVEDEKLTQLKQFTIKSMSNILANIHDCNGKKLKESLIDVEDMISYIIELGDVNKSLYDIQTYDNYTFIHSIDVCIMASFLGISAGYNNWDLKEIGVGAALHDVGKTKVPTAILNKRDRLTEEEFYEIKKHPIYGSQLLKKNFAISDNIIKMVEQHHERVDGKGYPYGLSNRQITKFAKLVCICDVYDAVSNDRCYRKKFSPNDAYELILSGSGSSFDQNLVSYFKNTFAIYPLGCCVKLSNGVEGYVIRQNRGFPDRPVIRVLYDAKTREAIPAFEIDLLKSTDLVIVTIVE